MAYLIKKPGVSLFGAGGNGKKKPAKSKKPVVSSKKSSEDKKNKGKPYSGRKGRKKASQNA